MYRLPTDEQIRSRILETKDEQRKLGFMAQYLFLGRVSEVFGKYTIPKDNVFLVDADGVEAVLFAVHTAKRRGKLRPVLLPLSKEPWVEPVYEYMVNNEQEYPFLLHENHATSKTYAMTTAKNLFKGFHWPMIDYTRSMDREYTKDMILNERFGDDGYKEYLVDFPDGLRTWTKDKKIAKISVKIESRWKKVTSHVLRKRRTLTLTMDHGFDGIDLSIIGGWTNSSQEQNMPQAIKHYLFLDIREAQENVSLLQSLAMRYFHKLL